MFSSQDYRSDSTILLLLESRLEQFRHLPAFCDLQNKKVTFGEFHQQARQLACGLVAAGLQPGDSVAILLPNGFEWEMAQFGIFLAGGVVIGLEAHATKERNSHIVSNSLCRFLFTNQTNLDGLLSDTKEFRSVFFVGAKNEMPSSFLRWEELLNSKTTSLPVVSKDDLAIIIYSSGTTGIPKGLAYTHGQVAGACELIVRIFPEIGMNCRLVCWLPLANLFQRMLNYCGLLVGASTYFESDPRNILQSISFVNPHLVVGVPRFYEKIYASVMAKVATSHWLLRAALNFCLWIGLQRHRKRLRLITFAFMPIADAFFLKRVRKVFGSSLRVALTGSAPLRPEIHDFFGTIRVPLFEAYGLSENILPVAMNSPSNRRIGSVGKPLISEDTRLSSEGEILVRGKGIHWQFKDGEKIAASLDPQGWFATGDLGEFDENGFLTITGRKAEFIKTSTGRKIAHIPIESRLAKIKFIEHAFLIGDQEKCLVAFLSIDKARLTSLDAKEELRVSILEQLQILNKDLGDNSRVRGALVLAQPLTIQGGELTSNLKIRKTVIQQKYRLLLKNLYEQIEEHHIEPTVVVAEGVQEKVRRLARFPPLARLNTNMWIRVGIIAALFFRSGVRGLLGWLSTDKHSYRTNIAKDILNTVGPLKGPMLKIGQMLFHMRNLLPEDIRKEIAPLVNESSPMEPRVARVVLEQEFGDKIDNIFSEFVDTPFATASITQLHWGRLKTGEEVAVKLKYPGIEDAIKADLLLLWLLVPILRITTGIQNLSQLYFEIRELFLRECNLEEEVRFQDKFAKTFSNDARVLVPRVYHRFSTRNVITMDFVRGVQFHQFAQNSPDEMRYQAAVTISEVNQRSIFIHGFFNADPHPGNFLFTDNQVVFLDFGYFKEWPSEFLLPWKEMIRASFKYDFESFLEAAIQLKMFPNRHHPGYFNLYKYYKHDPHLPKRPGAAEPTPEQSVNANTELVSFFFKEKEISIPVGFIAISRLFLEQLFLLIELNPNKRIFYQPRDVQEAILGAELTEELFGSRAQP